MIEEKTQTTDRFDELQQIMTDALLQMQKLVGEDERLGSAHLAQVKLFLVGVLSTAADLAEVVIPGAAPLIYADMEAAAKQGGLQAIQQHQAKGGSSYSVSRIAPDDVPTAMNYLGQSLGTALYKHLYELPEALRKPEMLLRGIEALLGNLLHQKFNISNDPHDILDSLCDHVHQALDDLEARRQMH